MSKYECKNCNIEIVEFISNMPGIPTQEIKYDKNSKIATVANFQFCA